MLLGVAWWWWYVAGALITGVVSAFFVDFDSDGDFFIPLIAIAWPITIIFLAFMLGWLGLSFLFTIPKRLYDKYS
ncbi:hypothetical protein KKH23_11090 [Patescibacteria group bacterium]|nr:hypothetical protein [Patescibacteria group bacterium]